ncbi:hypothetical protein CFP56_003480 [Quercus suber]|uniref:Prolamin-like domain-containing protein n=1 Tax=Quercus suber TaxID=58331 RepID=A0AAW0IJ55_QUESU
MLVPTGLAQLLQIPELFSIPGAGGPSGANGQCLSSIVNLLGCLTQILSSLINGQFGIVGSSCCNAITQIEENCLSKLLPTIHIFTPLLNNSCAQSPKGNGQVSELAAGKTSLPGLLAMLRGNKDIQQCWSVLTRQLEQDIAKCWSSLKIINGCILEIHESLSKEKFNVSGPACCKAITNVSDKCWPKMFPLNPLFPPLLKNSCAPIAAGPATKL